MSNADLEQLILELRDLERAHGRRSADSFVAVSRKLLEFLRTAGHGHVAVHAKDHVLSSRVEVRSFL